MYQLSLFVSQLWPFRLSATCSKSPVDLLPSTGNMPALTISIRFMFRPVWGAHKNVDKLPLTVQRRRLHPARGRDDVAAHHYQAIVESSDDAILSKDLDGVILSWNRGAEQLFGFTPRETVGRPVTIMIPLDRLDEEPVILEKIHRGERIEHFETVRQRKDGSLVDIR